MKGFTHFSSRKPCTVALGHDRGIGIEIGQFDQAVM
jgi:hypothetical protein